ncbi:F-box protein At3g07870-like [Bidens hawaiensis]|uniref:F-box protein At3g07870-like n=1 Tax=Bidens hawaiensis TaxID=980011 RepID=UPI004049E998
MFSKRRLEDVLPECVMFDIVSKLPVKTIMYCKCVCKKWRELLSNPDFVQLHLSRSPEALLIDKYSSWPGSYEWVEMDHLDPVKSINLNFCPREYTFGILQVGSVNGLICSCSQGYDDIYVFNPVLEEYMLLPEPRLKNLMSLSCGFGVSMTGEYKVVRICGRRILNPYRSMAVEIEIYTIGTGQWRLLGQTPYRIK